MMLALLLCVLMALCLVGLLRALAWLDRKAPLPPFDDRVGERTEREARRRLNARLDAEQIRERNEAWARHLKLM